MPAASRALRMPCPKIPLKPPEQQAIARERASSDIRYPILGIWDLRIAGHWRGGGRGRIARTQLQERLEFRLFIQSLALDALLVALKHSSTDVGVERR